jgi:hypothetical protein
MERPLPEPIATPVKPLLLLANEDGYGVGLFEGQAGPLDGSQMLSFIAHGYASGALALNREMRVSLAAVLVGNLRGGKKAKAAIMAMPDYPAEEESR